MKLHSIWKATEDINESVCDIRIKAKLFLQTLAFLGSKNRTGNTARGQCCQLFTTFYLFAINAVILRHYVCIYSAPHNLRGAR